MTAKVVVNVPGMPKGEPVEVLYLGMFANGETHNLSDEQIAQYETAGQRKFPSSGYIFAGEPHGEAQKKAYEANAQEGIESTRAVDLQPTQIDGVYSNPQTDVAEGSTEEGSK